MKKVILNFGFSLFVVTLLSVLTSPVVSALPGEKEFNAVKEQIINSARNVSTYGAAEALAELNRNAVLFDKLYLKVKNARHVDDVIDEVTDGLVKLSNSYGKIADMGIRIFQVHNGEFAALRNKQGFTLRTVRELTAERDGHVQKRQRLTRYVETEPNEIEKQKMRVSIKASKSIIHSLEAQIVIWEKFYSAQKRLLAKLELTSERIGLLVHILKENAEVYKQAANVARLRRSALAALRNLSALEDLQTLLGDIENQWLEVDDLVNKISEVEFELTF